jgi:O-antigen/teichoic acid export membrane protein
MRPARDMLWLGAEAAASAVFSVISAFVVARLVGPAEVGIGAAAVATHVLLWVGVNALFADAIVQRSALDETAAASAFWASSMVGLAAAALQAGAGWPLAWALRDERLIGMSLALAAPLPLVGAAGAIAGRATRDRRYRLLAWRALLGQGAGTAVGIVCALSGAGGWALVAQQAAGSAGGALVLLVGAGWRPALTFRWGPVSEMLRVGLPLTASTLVLHGRYRLFAVLIGGTAGPTALGEVHLAFRLVDTVRELVSTALWRLMLPRMAACQEDPDALRAAIDRWLAGSGLVVFPMCGAMLVSLPLLTQLVLGPVWAPSGQATVPLTLLAAWLFLGFPAGVATVARGVTQYVLRSNVASTLVLVMSVLVMRPHRAVVAAEIWVAAQVMVAPYTWLTNARVLDSPVRLLLRAGVPTLVLAALATAAAFAGPWVAGGPVQPAAVIAVRLAIGAAICGVGLVRLRPWRMPGLRSGAALPS